MVEKVMQFNQRLGFGKKTIIINWFVSIFIQKRVLFDEKEKP